MSVIKQALWVIERHLFRKLPLTEIAEACGVTAPHLSQAFANGVGLPVSAYIRARRLSRAAETLANGAPDILRVALDSGYGSHEAFSRAFKRQFGQSPEEVRLAASVSALALYHPDNMIEDLHPGIRLHGRKSLPAKRMAGLKARLPPEGMQQIPELWRRFGTLLDEVEGSAGAAPFGLCRPTATRGDLTYACAIDIGPSGATPAGMTEIRVAAADYALFRHAGHVAAIPGTYRRILDTALPENGWSLAAGWMLEAHDEGFDVQTGQGGVTIWVPIVSAKSPRPER